MPRIITSFTPHFVYPQTVSFFLFSEISLKLAPHTHPRRRKAAANRKEKVLRRSQDRKKDMISSMQPSRPKVPRPDPPPPLNQQQTRTSSTLSSQTPLARIPRSQMEAMPPFSSTPRNQHEPVLTQSTLDPSKRHPVFFTQRLKKAPAGASVGSGWSSPVAAGYVFDNGGRRVGGVKL
ncbi:hypothetical protein BUE80_DR007296 [Diplocarpon rosae]|nr:hypothetical protein BUE80_DR007296 [Diplocarpon rosae]